MSADHTDPMRTGSFTYHLYGEGPNDVGRTRPDGTRESEGCYDHLLRGAAASAKAKLSALRAGPYRQLLAKLPGGRARTCGLRGFARHAYLATTEAALDDADLVVVTTDTDREAGRRTARRVRRTRDRKVGELHAGYERAVRDLRRHDPEAPVPSLVIAVPMLKLDAWLVADASAFQKAVGRPRPPLPKKAEELGGQTDPKALLEQWGAAAARLELAREADPEVLDEECPVSYPPFRKMVVEAVGSRSLRSGGARGRPGRLEPPRPRYIVPASSGSSHRTTIIRRGPCAGITSVFSMSAVRLGPVRSTSRRSREAVGRAARRA